MRQSDASVGGDESLTVIAYCSILKRGVNLLRFLFLANQLYEQGDAVPDVRLPFGLSLHQLQVCLATLYLSAGRADFGTA